MRKDSENSVIAAAGGVVSDMNGRLLMMFRRGMWDLPKGHLDEGETLPECAVREVCEECGLDPAALTIVHELIRTRHSYLTADGLSETKQVTWFLMTYSGNPDALTPQSEEDITALEWVSLSEARRRAASSFTTIQQVIQTLQI